MIFSEDYSLHNQGKLETDESKIIWPWPQRGEEGFEEKIGLLKERGYKEWRSSSKTERRCMWQIQNPIIPKTSESLHFLSSRKLQITVCTANCFIFKASKSWNKWRKWNNWRWVEPPARKRGSTEKIPSKISNHDRKYMYRNSTLSRFEYFVAIWEQKLKDKKTFNK